MKDVTSSGITRRGILKMGIGLGSLVVLTVGCSSQPATPTTASVAPTQASAAQPTAASAQSTSAPAMALTSATSPPAQPSLAAAVPSGQEVLLNGAGSTFDNPLFSKAFSEFTKKYPNIKVNYQSVGSGAGIEQLTKGTVDFGASDAPMTDEQIKAAGGDIIHIPITLGAV